MADSLSLREFLGYEMTDGTPDHSTISRTRRLIDVDTHQDVFRAEDPKLGTTACKRASASSRTQELSVDEGGQRLESAPVSAEIGDCGVFSLGRWTAVGKRPS